MNEDKHLKLTAGFLTIWFIAVLLLLASRAEPVKQNDSQLEELKILLRPLAIQMGGTEEFLRQGIGESEEANVLKETLKNQMSEPLNVLFLSKDALHTDSSYILGAGMAAAYGMEEMSSNLVSRIRTDRPEKDWLVQLLNCPAWRTAKLQNYPINLKRVILMLQGLLKTRLQLYLNLKKHYKQQEIDLQN